MWDRSVLFLLAANTRTQETYERNTLRFLFSLKVTCTKESLLKTQTVISLSTSGCKCTKIDYEIEAKKLEYDSEFQFRSTQNKLILFEFF